VGKIKKQQNEPIQTAFPRFKRGFLRVALFLKFTRRGGSYCRDAFASDTPEPRLPEWAFTSCLVASLP
jgi:hypothetical protein